MAFGISRKELNNWKSLVLSGEIAFITHYWQDARFKDCHTVTKVGCKDIHRLIEWGYMYDLKKEWIDPHPLYPHFDLFGETQKKILLNEGLVKHIQRFNL